MALKEGAEGGVSGRINLNPVRLFEGARPIVSPKGGQSAYLMVDVASEIGLAEITLQTADAPFIECVAADALSNDALAPVDAS
jgi:hypothetical protein